MEMFSFSVAYFINKPSFLSQGDLSSSVFSGGLMCFEQCMSKGFYDGLGFAYNKGLMGVVASGGA